MFRTHAPLKFAVTQNQAGGLRSTHSPLNWLQETFYHEKVSLRVRLIHVSKCFLKKIKNPKLVILCQSFLPKKTKNEILLTENDVHSI